MNLQQIHSRLSLQIIGFNFSLIAITVVLYFMGGFDKEEFSSILTFLSSISAIYIGTLVKYIGNNLKKKDSLENQNQELPFAKAIGLIVPLHFVLLIGIIGAKAFTQITFQEMNFALLIVEMLFGAYIGSFITSMFYVKKESVND